jgi:hypothetical protein
VCIDACYLDAGNPPTEFGTVLSPELRVWILDHDEIVPARGDRNGCAQLEGLPQNAQLLRAIAASPSHSTMPSSATASYVPVLAPIRTSLGDSTFRLRLAGVLPYAVGGAIDMLSVQHGDLPLDLRSAAVFSVAVCHQHPAERPTAADACRSFESQLAGVSVALDTGGHAYYPIDASAVDKNATATLGVALGSLALFLNVPPGERQIELTSSDATHPLDCTSDTGVGWRGADETAAKNVFSVAPRPGFMYAATIFCDSTGTATAAASK